MGMIALSGGISLLVAVIVTPLLIPVLHKLKFGQVIRDEGPSWHQKKNGTPTMGGIAMIAALVIGCVISYALFGSLGRLSACLIVTAVLFGAIGFWDDYIKVVKKRNLGLTAAQKFTAQFAVAVLSCLYMMYAGEIGSEIYIPGVKNCVDIGFFALPLAVLVQLAVVNSVNLTDGIDGLASGVTLIVSLFFALCAWKLEKLTVCAFMIATAAACLGFFMYNKNPAKLFMGDTGSLFLGGAVAVAAISLKMPLFLIIAGFVYLFETLSVIIQVISFKTTGKRVFKMTPIHHHFEKCGWNEKKIDAVFCGITLLLCIVSYFLMF